MVESRRGRGLGRLLPRLQSKPSTGFRNTISMPGPHTRHPHTLPLAPAIDLWYGDHQPFGRNGIPQTWVNILGKVASRNGIASLTYSLNRGPERSLWIGKTRTRLVDPGDFNVEVSY